jgi:hypothetical protein
MVVEFQAKAIMHPAAWEAGFGRVFRSFTLFGDMVKCILCNCHPFVRVVETIGKGREIEIVVFHFYC